MVETLVTALICATACWLSREAWHVLDRTWAADRGAQLRRFADESLAVQETAQLEGRWIAVAEREIALKERMHSERPVMEPMPADLEARCQSWDDLFMQEQERSTIQSLYGELKDWDEVRRRLAPLPVYKEIEPALGDRWMS